MEKCACGMVRRQFWIWEDVGGGSHASRFAPSAGVVRSVVAATSRDALLSATGGAPRHDVADTENQAESWPGRCSPAELAG